jgi:hypothetical protein
VAQGRERPGLVLQLLEAAELGGAGAVDLVRRLANKNRGDPVARPS